MFLRFLANFLRPDLTSVFLGVTPYPEPVFSIQVASFCVPCPCGLQYSRVTYTTITVPCPICGQDGWTFRYVSIEQVSIYEFLFGSFDIDSDRSRPFWF